MEKPGNKFSVLQYTDEQYSITYPQKNWPTYKLAGSQKSHPHPPLNQNPTPWLETGPVDTCEYDRCIKTLGIVELRKSTIAIYQPLSYEGNFGIF